MSAPVASAPVPIVLLAAGAGERYGGVKQLALIDGEPMLRRVARILLEINGPVIVVTGAHAAQVETALAGLPVRIERHSGWTDGMGSSLAAGVRRAIMDCSDATGVLICLADQPLLDLAMLRQMLARHAVAAGSILATSLRGIDGPPVLFPRDCLEALANWSGARGARELLEREAHRVERFTAASMADVDTPADLERACRMLALHRNTRS